MFDLICTDLEFSYPQTPNFRLSIPELTCPLNSPLAIYGLAGSGKSTFGKIIGGLLTASKGICKLKASGLTRLEDNSPPRVLYLPQFPEQIFLGMNIGNALQIMLKWHNPATDLKVRFTSNLKRFGLDYDRIRERYGCELSFGELRLTTIALGLTFAPELTIFDEPTIALSRSARTKYSDTIEEFSLQKAVIIISHDYHLLRKLCRSVLIFEEGNIIFKGKWEELDRNLAIIRRVGLDLLEPLNQRNVGNE